MNFLDQIREWDVYIMIGLLCFTIILFILVIILLSKQDRINKKYSLFMAGKEGKDLEEAILSKFSLIDHLQAETNQISKEINEINRNLNISYQKVGIVKYDAFKEVGGKLSFALAMLTKENDGFIMNCMHSSREGCFTYMKTISKGESFVILSEEEVQALEEAKKTKL